MKNFELIGKYIFFVEKNDYPPYKVNKTLIGEADSLRKCNAFLKKYCQGESYVLIDTIRK